MAAAAGIVSMVFSAFGMSQEQKSAERAKQAGEEGARSIMDETRTNIEQTRKSQAQTLGMAKAIAAASGIKFDASKIADTKFTEGGVSRWSKEREEWKLETIGMSNLSTFDMLGGMVAGPSTFAQGPTKWTDTGETELSYGEQIAGAEEGDSTFTYLREMKREFAKDIGWQSKQGRSRAKVARLGGTVAYAQGQARTAQTAASTTQSAYNWWKQS